MKNKVIKAVATVLVVVLVLGLLQELLVPKYMTDTVEGAMIEEYYSSEKIHDVMFLGDCEVYETFSPCRLWEKYGISSYIRGSAQQLMWQSYYLLEDALKYETPQVVVLSIMSLMHEEPQSEAYNRMTLEGMRWSYTKYNAIKASMTEGESMLEYAFPILRYHTRWNSLTRDDFTYLFYRDSVTYEGYHMRVDIKPLTGLPEPKVLADYTFAEYPLEYLDKIRQLCYDRGIELVFVKAPSLYPHWYKEWDEQVVEYANKYDITYYNFIELAHKVGIDYSTDTYDAGMHMNLYGAEKLSDYIGEKLVKEHGVTVRSQDEKYSRYWDKKLADYNRAIEEKVNGL